MHCTFCIVPQTRGAERSRTDRGDRDAKCAELVARGVKEVTLLGQIVNLYGRHEFPKRRRQKSPFVQLLEAVHEVDGLERLALHLAAPDRLPRRSDRRLRRVAEARRHVHLPLQSGSDRILKAMHRAYTAEKYFDWSTMRARAAGIALTTDIIVGFPGETDEDYADTRAGRGSRLR